MHLNYQCTQKIAANRTKPQNMHTIHLLIYISAVHSSTWDIVSFNNIYSASESTCSIKLQILLDLFPE